LNIALWTILIIINLFSCVLYKLYLRGEINISLIWFEYFICNIFTVVGVLGTHVHTLNFYFVIYFVAFVLIYQITKYIANLFKSVDHDLCFIGCGLYVMTCIHKQKLNIAVPFRICPISGQQRYAAFIYFLHRLLYNSLLHA